MQTYDSIIHTMSLREKVCQMVMGQLWGTRVTEEFSEFLQAYPLGAYRLAGWNIQDGAQVRAFTDQVRDVFAQHGWSEPVIASDEEGGTLCIFRGIIPSFPGTMALGAIASPSLVRRQMRVIGGYLRELGISMNFAPVCDTQLNPRNAVVGVRSFGEDAGLCGRLALEAAIGTNEAGLLNCAKHFPGHGATLADSHFTFALDNLSREAFEKAELASFRPCIEADVDSIFVDHVVYPCIDSELPASLSPRMITGVLREQCGYQGVIMTDDLNMKAIVDKWGIPQASLLFLQAGGDMAMTCATPETLAQTIDCLERAVESGALPMTQVDQSVARILRMKARLLAYRAQQPAWEDAHALSSQIAREAMTNLRDPQNLIPLRRGQRVLVVLPHMENMTLSDTTAHTKVRFGAYLDGYCAQVMTEEIPRQPDQGDIQRVLQVAAKADMVIQLMYGALIYTGQAQLFQALKDAGISALALLIREPYDAMALPPESTVVCAYSAIDESMRAAADALFGACAMPGTVPVTLKERDFA